MVGELRDIRDFLARCQPFALLPPATLDELPGRFTVRYLRRGTRFPPDDEDPRAFYLLRKGAVEIRAESGVLIARLAEGEHCDEAAEAAVRDARCSGVAIEDTLLYVLPADELDALREADARFNASFEQTLKGRLQGARDAILAAPPVGGNLLRLAVGDLLARDPVTARAEMSVCDAAGLMTRERVSALMVVEGGNLRGIVTDRDLRSRFVAAAADPATPLGRIMTAAPVTISREASAFDALLKMTEHRVHHLPVVHDDRLCGLVSTHDLLRVQSSNPLHVADRIRRASSVSALGSDCEQMRELHLQLMAAHATARQLGHAITAVADAATRRLIELAIDRQGSPPVPFAWIATGSQGRGELGVGSDQDNSMILDDAYEEATQGVYFDELARFVNSGLATCGFRLCPGEVMASNPRWRQPVSRWHEYLRSWVDHADHTSATLVANFFDMRTVWGEDSLRDALMRSELPRCADNESFLAHLAGHALGARPPLGFFRRFVLTHDEQQEGTVDLKVQGLIPIVDLARFYALRSAAAMVETEDRLHAAVSSGLLSEDGADNLRVAFEFIGTLRALHQADCLRRNEAVDNRVAPAALIDLERRHLKDAFAAVTTVQESLRAAYHGRLPL